jgi:hypothetical protein
MCVCVTISELMNTWKLKNEGEQRLKGRKKTSKLLIHIPVLLLQRLPRNVLLAATHRESTLRAEHRLFTFGPQAHQTCLPRTTTSTHLQTLKTRFRIFTSCLGSASHRQPPYSQNPEYPPLRALLNTKPQNQNLACTKSKSYSQLLVSVKILILWFWVREDGCVPVLVELAGCKSISTGAQYVTLDNKIKCLSLAVFFLGQPLLTGTAYMWRLPLANHLDQSYYDWPIRNTEPQSGPIHYTLFFWEVHNFVAPLPATNLVQKNEFPELNWRILTLLQ